MAADLGQLRESFKGKCPEVRAAYRILNAGHKSVVGLAGALDDLETARRGANGESRGRAAARESDLLRSMIVFTSSALDASMQRLVNDIGRAMIRHAGSTARRQYESHMMQMLPKGTVDEDLKQAVIKEEPTDALLNYYFRQKTKASYQGSGDLKTRVKSVLGIPSAAVADSQIEALDSFFTSRNQIVHAMDLVDATHQSSTARNFRSAEVTATQCSEVFSVAADLCNAAALKLVSLNRTA